MNTHCLPVVEFGKYKGQPVTDLLNDTKYLEWCKQQAWFKKYPIIFNICVNQVINTNTDSKTPEHNILQKLFLAKKNIENFLQKMIPRYNTFDVRRIRFETIYNWDVLLEGVLMYNCSCSENGECFECDEYWNGEDARIDICIEIKPLLGDDYPCVLRKMNTQIELTNQKYIREKTKTPRYALLLKEFNSTTTTLDELVKIFKQSNIRVIFVSDFIQLSQEQPLEEIPLKSKTPRTITDFFKKK